MHIVQEGETGGLAFQVRRLQVYNVLLEGMSEDVVENRGTQV